MPLIFRPCPTPITSIDRVSSPVHTSITPFAWSSSINFFSSLPSPTLSHADHVDSQGLGLSHSVEYAARLNCSSIYPTQPTLMANGGPGLNYRLRIVPAMEARGVALPSKCPPFLPKHLSPNRKGTTTPAFAQSRCDGCKRRVGT